MTAPAESLTPDLIEALDFQDSSAYAAKALGHLGSKASKAANALKWATGLHDDKIRKQSAQAFARVTSTEPPRAGDEAEDREFEFVPAWHYVEKALCARIIDDH